MRLATLTLILGLVVTGCSDAAADLPAGADECPITIPEPEFTPPDGYPEARDGLAWFGTDELWTALPVDGDYAQRKSIWWSTLFQGPPDEERPEISVSWTRYGEIGPHASWGPLGTNGYTVEDGWFMLAGIDPIDHGCWTVSATYRDATLTYTYFNDGA